MAERFGVAVAGTHGKSTTTAMIAYALLQCGADPSFVVGGTVPQLGGGSRSGGEQRRSSPRRASSTAASTTCARTVALITNIEEDHLDCYKDIDEIVAVVPHVRPARARRRPDHRQRRRTRTSARRSAGMATRDRVRRARARGRPGARASTGIEQRLPPRARPAQRQARRDAEAVRRRRAQPVQRDDGRGRVRRVRRRPGSRPPTRSARFTGVDRRMTRDGHVQRRDRRRRLRPPPHRDPRDAQGPARALPAASGCSASSSRTSTAARGSCSTTSPPASPRPTRRSCPDIYFVRDSEAERQRVSADDLVERINDNGQHALHICRSSTAIVEHLQREVARGRPGRDDGRGQRVGDRARSGRVKQRIRYWMLVTCSATVTSDGIDVSQ